MSASVISISGLTRSFAGDPPIDVLRGVELEVARGDHLAILGQSGSGKSTLLNVLGLLDRPTAGSYRLDGVETTELADGDRAAARGSRIGFVFQSFHLLPHRDVEENVMLAELYQRQPRHGRRERAVEALQQVGLGHRLGSLPAKLSGGERQRVAIARALMCEPALLLCDEPTGNLDSENTLAVARPVRRAEPCRHDHRRHHPRSSRGSAGRPTRRHDRRLSGGAMSRSRMSTRDLVEEALAGVLARPLRTVLTVLGTVLGVSALVATLGISSTASNQIVGRFNALEATAVVVQPVTASNGGKSRALVALPWNAEDRLRLNGVRAGGALADISVAGDSEPVRRLPNRSPSSEGEASLRTVAVTPGLLNAIRGRMGQGRWFDAGNDARADRVVVLGSGAAERLGIDRIDGRSAVFIGDEAFTVIGILDSTRRELDLLDSVMFPAGLAASRYGVTSPTKVVIDTELGAAQLVARQAGLALSPNDPDAVRVAAPPSLRRSQKGVEGDANSLFLVLGGVTLVVGAIGIANVTLVTVLERVGEIGLRRALGASRRHIAMQFLVESAVLGLLGGTVGASLGVGVTVIVSVVRDWTPVLSPVVPLAAPFLGAVTGLVAGLYPSIRAATLEPVDALRAGV